MSGSIPSLPRDQKIETRAKPQLCHMKSGGKARRQVVAVQEHMAGFRDAVFKAEIRIIKTRRDGNIPVPPFDPSCLVSHDFTRYKAPNDATLRANEGRGNGRHHG